MNKHIYIQSYLFTAYVKTGKEQKGFDALKQEIINKAKENIKNIEETISMIEKLSINDTMLKVSKKLTKNKK